MSKRTRKRGKVLATARERGAAPAKARETWTVKYRDGSSEQVAGTFAAAQAHAVESGKRLLSITAGE